MNSLESWVMVLSLTVGIAWTTTQAYRLAKWKENH